MTPVTSTGRHVVSTRLTSIMRIATVDYPSDRELQSILSAYLVPILTHVTPDAVSKNYSLAEACVRTYDQVRRIGFCLNQRETY